MRPASVLFFFLLWAAVFAQGKSTLHVKVIGADPGDRMVVYEVTRDNKMEEVTAQMFSLGGDTLTLFTDRTDRMLRLFFEPEDGKKSQVMVFAEKGKTYKVEAYRGDFPMAQVSGGLYDAPNIKAIGALERRRDSITRVVISLSSQNDKEAPLAQAMESLTQTHKDLVSAKERFVVYHPESSYSAFLVADLMSSIPQYTTVDKVKRLYNSLNGGARNTYAGEAANEQVYALLSSSEGAEVPEFALTSLSGESVSPSHYRGKWLLLEFWASWCKPCRLSNPELVRLYKEYHERGLEVVGIACWDKEDAWKTAVVQDSLPWTQVNSGEKVEGQQSVDKTFAIMGVPTSILVAPDGKIVFRGHPGDVRKKLEEFMGK